jgi:hypothetical protein
MCHVGDVPHVRVICSFGSWLVMSLGDTCHARWNVVEVVCVRGSIWGRERMLTSSNFVASIRSRPLITNSRGSLDLV